MEVETRHLRLLLCDILYDCYGASKKVPVVHFLQKPGEKPPVLMHDAFFSSMKHCSFPEILLQKGVIGNATPDPVLKEAFERAQQWKFFQLKLSRDGYTEQVIVEVRKGACDIPLHELVPVEIELHN